MEKIIIAAISQNSVIGKDGQLPCWDIPGDLNRFRELTSFHPVLMGRKTADSLKKALPNRHNIVLTRQNYERPSFQPIPSFDIALSYLENQKNQLDSIDYSKVYIIGGSQIYRLALPLVDTLEITHVKGIYDGDTFFPIIGPEFVEWNRVDLNTHSYATYKRR